MEGQELSVGVYSHYFELMESNYLSLSNRWRLFLDRLYYHLCQPNDHFTYHRQLLLHFRFDSIFELVIELNFVILLLLYICYHLNLINSLQFRHTLTFNLPILAHFDDQNRLKSKDIDVKFICLLLNYYKLLLLIEYDHHFHHLYYYLMF